MRRSTQTTVFLIVLLAMLLSACGGNNAQESDAIMTEAAAIAIAGLTQTAEARPTNTPTLEPTATPTEVPTATPTETPEGGIPTPTVTVASSSSGSDGGNTGNTSSNAPCLRASFETETVPDGTRFYTDEVFTKSWRVKNTGTCTWNEGFNVVWVDGDLMNATSVNAFTSVDVRPGEYASVEVTMQAPGTPGTYKGYWMLRSNNGEFFGVGFNGKAWLWVEIEAYSTE